MLTYVLASDGSPLMPTYNIRKVRRMLKDGRAAIAGHKPGLTIRLTYPLKKQEASYIFYMRFFFAKSVFIAPFFSIKEKSFFRKRILRGRKGKSHGI